jgi:hypothetical protein
MHRLQKLSGMALLVMGLWAQETPNLFQAAPPEVEGALRKRVTEFYKLVEEGRFRQTDGYLAEDAKDIYYEQEKKRIRGHEIVRVNWADDFKKAVVVTVIQTEVVMRGVVTPVGAPVSSRWRFEDGKWVQFFDTLAGKPTPFGPMKAGPNQTKGLSPEEMLKNPEVIFNQIKVEKDQVLLKSYAKSEESIRVLNGMPGGITVLYVPDQVIPGFTYKVEPPEIGAGEEAKVWFRFDPGSSTAPRPTISGKIRVEPFGKSYAVTIRFDIPEETKKQLPKKP